MKQVIVLAGHTHGGQINASPSPSQWLASRCAFNQLGYRSHFIQGLEILDNGSLVHVSPGLGWTEWHGLRTVRPEATLLEFKPMEVR